MIPKHKGLVPAMRGPTTPSTASSTTTTRSVAATATTSTAAATVHRYVIQPSHAYAATNSSSPPQTTLTEERRLYTFLPSADMAAPPRELRVASYFFADAEPSSMAACGDYDGSDNDDDDVEDDALGGATPSSAGAASTGHKRRRRRRNREPMRLEYQSTLEPSSEQPSAAAAASGGVAKLASTPVPAYSHLACILLELPTGWREEQSSADAEGDTTASSPLVPATVIVQPVLQLWCERRESGEVSAVLGGDATSTSSGWGGISKSWLSSSTRISKKDWKTMDAADADMHKRINWSDDDNGGSGDETGETAQSLRDKKRAKAEATSSAVRSFLAGTKVALRQQRMGGEEEEGEAPRELPRKQPMSPPAPPTKPVLKLSLRPAATCTSSTTVAATAAHTLKVLSPSSASAPAAAATSPPPPPPSPPPPQQQQSQQSVAGSVTLPSLAAAVVSEVRWAEGRTSATMMELQKRILKQLPDFAVMNQKMKVTETKREAVEWFQSCQRELRVWLNGQGHAIASDGMVSFGG